MMTQSAAAEQRFRCSLDVASEKLGPELLLVQLAKGTTFRLNGTGAAIWELAAEGCSAEEIAERLHAGYGVSQVRLQADAAALLADLAENDLLEPCAEGGE
jgi:uncharacterized protein YbjT (DUF2867 family)